MISAFATSLLTNSKWWYCCTSHLPGLLPLHFFCHRPMKAKSLVSPRLTGAKVPPKFHLRTLLHARPSSRQPPCGRGLGSVRSFSGTKTSLTIQLELHCLDEGFFWPSLSPDWTSTRNEDSDDLDDLRLQNSSCFLRLIRRTKAGSEIRRLSSHESVP